MSLNLSDFEPIIYLHICRKPQLFKVVDPDFFRNIYVNKLFWLTKQFYNKFGTLPFDIEQPSSEQLQRLAKSNIDKLIINKDVDKSANYKNFINNVENIITANYNGYQLDWLEETVEKGWINWESSEKGFRLAIEYRRSQGAITPENVVAVNNKCFEIISNYSSVNLDLEHSLDFLDAKSHKPIPLEGLMNSGYAILNEWLSGSQYGGFKGGTVTLIIAEPNIGKSITLGNIALNLMRNGVNVFLPSLEMDIPDIYKRLGSNALNISMDDYDKIAENEAELQRLLLNWKTMSISSSMDDFSGETDITGFPKSMGILRAKRFSEASIRDLTAFYKSEEKSLGITYGAIILDYFTELDNIYGINKSDTYMYHKTNMSDMYRDAVKNNKAWITAHQLKGDSFGAEDLTLSSMSESRGLAHRPDNIWGLIQTPQMKLDNRYHLKNIKSRTGKFKNYRNELIINYDNMKLMESGRHIQPNEI